MKIDHNFNNSTTSSDKISKLKQGTVQFSSYYNQSFLKL